ncbi:uncharacterized protein LOC112258191 isoform X2 [Oncorhynchus tshawytscha]|uniref:Kinesin motor domain-containing protein n=1 Tax=Oncorhynchus tshawytscha TaxID=74940 RepID=A0A8C8CWB3_ONCTS|nr:uncharacterized protein LOC112258191 isoform X2 [Oncorhynchus tshawytscha]
MASVRVAVRVRPLIKREKEVSAKVIIHMEGSTTSIDCNKKHLSKGTPGTGLKDRGRQSFSYDFSYDSTDVRSPNFVPQEKVFKDLGCDVLEAAFDGYNACVFAYGQTGSGKSHTMMGSPGDFGLIPRICEGLFCQISEKSQGDGASFRTEVSYLEIYNERVQDLLTTKSSPENGSGLKVREHPKDGPYVEDLSKHLVQNYRDIEKLLHAGKAKRTTSSTGMNDVSSRSHAIFTINFTQARFDAELPCEMVSKIHLVDLAGSERADATCATGARLKEGANINKSLVTLGIVISALGGDRGGSHKGKRKKQLFIPYRDSVLTWLLKDSLGGNSKTIMIATLSPADVNYSETLSTLHYANRAKNIFNKPTVNEDSSVTVIRKLQEEIVRLKLLVEKNNQACLSPQDLSKTLKVEEKLHKNEVKVLELTREWTNKWGETQNILKEETVALRKQGIGVVMDSKLPHLIGIDDDLLSTGIILYHLKEGRTLVGRDEASSNPDIVLHGAGLLEEHCVFENRDGVVTLIPQTGALCSVNRLEMTQPCQLTQGAVIQLGRGTIFRFNHPKEAAHLREQRKSGLLSSLSLTDFSRLFHPGNRMDVFAEAGEKGDSRQQRSSVLSPQLQSCTVMTKAMPMEAPVSVSRHPSACYAVPLQIGAGALQHLQAVSSLQAGVNGWSFGAAEGHERPCRSTNVESQRRARASPVHRTGTPTLTSSPTLTPTALEWDSLQQGLEGEVVEEWDLCHQSASGVGVSDRWLEGALPLRRAREEGGLYWGEEAWSEPGDEERNRALQQTPVLLVQQADVCTVGLKGLPGPANKSPGVLSGLPDGCRVLGGVLATTCCRGDLSRAGAHYGGPAGTSLSTAVSYLQRGDGGRIDGWTEERMDRAHLPQASSSSTYTQTSPSRFDTHTPSVSQLDNHSQATHTASLSQIDTHNCSQATHTATRQDRHRRSQAVRGLPLEALEGQFSRVMMDRSRMTVEGHRENDKEGDAGARREEVEQSFRLGAPVSRVFREEEERKEENQFSVSGLSALVRRVCQISGIGEEQELDSLGEEVSGMGSLVSRGLSWMFPDTGRLLRSSTPRILQQVWEGTGVLQPAAGGGAGSLQPGAGGGASSNWSSQVVRESQVLSVVKDSQVFSLVRESHMYSLVRDSHVFSMVSELPFVHHISTELTQDFRIIHNKLTQVLQPVESTGLQQKDIDLNKTPEIKLPLVHNTVLSTVPSLYPAHNTIEFANKQSTGKEVDWRTEDHSPISELACTSEQEGKEEALAKSEEQSPVRELQCTSEHQGREKSLAKSEEQRTIREVEWTTEQEGRAEALAKSAEQSPIRELECTSELEGKEEALAKSEEPSPIREMECTLEQEGGKEALAMSEEWSPIREVESTSELEGREEALPKSEEQNPVREVEWTSEQEGREEALAKSAEQSPIRELECTSELEGKEEALAKSEEPSPIREMECTLEQEGGKEALAMSEEWSPIREVESTSELEGREEALPKSEEQNPVRELECTSEHEGKEEAQALSEEPRPIRELQCISEHEGGEEALAKSGEPSSIRELEYTLEQEGREEALAQSEEQSPIRKLQWTSEHEGGDEALAKSEEPSPSRELACTLEQEVIEEALAKSEEQSPIRELQWTSEHEGGDEALAKSEEPSPIREVECSLEHEGREEALAKLEEQSPVREVECSLEQEGREEALAKLEEQSPVRELECTSEHEGKEEAQALSEEQCPIREVECTSEHEGGDEAKAKSDEPSPSRELQSTSEHEGREEALPKLEEQNPVREVECSAENKGGDEALAKLEEQSPVRVLECSLEQEGREEALAKSEDPSSTRELECTSEHEGGEEALSKSEDPSSTRELECTLEHEGGEEALSKSEEQSITKKVLWSSKDQIEIVEDKHCVTCGAKSTKSQPPPEQRNNTSSTGPENIFIPGHGNQRTDDVQVYYGSLVEFPEALVKLQSLPVSTLLGCLQSVLPSVFTSQRLLALYWLGVANCSQPHPHLALVLLLESCLYALTFDPDMTDRTTPLTVFHHLPLLQVKEILVGFGGQSLRLKASSEECVLTLYTHSQTLTQALTHTMLGVLCPGDQRLSQHPLLVENLMVLSLDWKAQAPDLLLNAELRLSGQFHRTLADLVYLVHGNMNREKPHLGEVRLLLYTSVGVTTTPDPRPDPWAQLLLTDTHLGLVQEDTVFHPAPHHVPLLSRQAQFKGVTLRCLSDVQCVIVRDGVGSSTSVCGDGAGDEGGATRLDIILSQDWRTRRERPRGHPERGAVAEADGSAVGGVAGASVLSAASNSCPPQQQAEVWKLHFSCSSEAACLINHLSNV